MAEEGGDGERARRQAGSLGWLAQSSMQPRKAQKIEGVTSAGMVALKASVYKAQKEAALLREGKLDMADLRTQRRAAGASVLDRSNTGVHERDSLDKLHIKTTSDRLAESSVALERKAALYDRLASGDGAGGVDTEGEHYVVDFLMKAAHTPAVDSADAASRSVTGGLLSGDMERELERRGWEAEATANLALEQAVEERRRQRREVMGAVAEETKAGREATAGAREQRAVADATRRERLRQAFLRKQLEHLRAKQAAGAAATGSGGGSKGAGPQWPEQPRREQHHHHHHRGRSP